MADWRSVGERKRYSATPAVDQQPFVEQYHENTKGQLPRADADVNATPTSSSHRHGVCSRGWML